VKRYQHENKAKHVAIQQRQQHDQQLIIIIVSTVLSKPLPQLTTWLQMCQIITLCFSLKKFAILHYLADQSNVMW